MGVVGFFRDSGAAAQAGRVSSPASAVCLPGSQSAPPEHPAPVSGVSAASSACRSRVENPQRSKIALRSRGRDPLRPLMHTPLFFLQKGNGFCSDMMFANYWKSVSSNPRLM